MAQRYAVLRVIAVVFKIFAWVALVVGVVGFFAVLVGGNAYPSHLWIGESSRVGGAIIFLVGGTVYFILLYACAEGIYVFLDIEENTRITAQMVNRLIAGQVQAASAVAPTPPVAPSGPGREPLPAKPPAAPPGVPPQAG